MDIVSPAPTPEEALDLKRRRELDENALRTIFLEARTANGFLDASIPRELLERAIELAELGPTSANCLPVRYVFVESAAAKELLKPALSAGNLDKTMKAPATAIVATDLTFYEKFVQTFPTRPEMVERFAARPLEETRAFARDNALLQMGYFIIALRAVGLDAGPMGGFERPLVDAAFFPDGRFIALFLINIGYADDTKTPPRLPRLAPAEIAAFR
jgi:3-hydroxypropanoate dehydrogenase